MGGCWAESSLENAECGGIQFLCGGWFAVFFFGEPGGGWSFAGGLGGEVDGEWERDLEWGDWVGEV